MKDAEASAALGRIEIVCGNCKNNDDGICDKCGWLVEDDDKPHCKGGWEWMGS